MSTALAPKAVRTAFCLVAALHSSAAAQVLQYRPTPDTLRYESVNSYFLYFVRGGDTLGQPVSTRTLESRYFLATGGNLDIRVRLDGLDEPRFSSENSYTVTPTGQLVLVSGRPAADVPNARVDLLLRLPRSTGDLQVGHVWDDSITAGGSRPYGTTSYRVRRRYLVARMVDTLGTQLALIIGQGRMHIRQGGWQDSASAVVWWQEVDGPVIDSTWFDTRSGQIHASFTTMDLSGVGGAGPIGGGLRMPSGLRSSVRLTRRM
jgi:hypothetical protein